MNEKDKKHYYQKFLDSLTDVTKFSKAMDAIMTEHGDLLYKVITKSNELLRMELSARSSEPGKAAEENSEGKAIEKFFEYCRKNPQEKVENEMDGKLLMFQKENFPAYTRLVYAIFNADFYCKNEKGFSINFEIREKVIESTRSAGLGKKISKPGFNDGMSAIQKGEIWIPFITEQLELDAAFKDAQKEAAIILGK